MNNPPFALSKSDRATARQHFAEQNLGNCRIETLKADMSFRTYYRVWQQNGGADEADKPLVLMDVPPERESLLPFLTVGEHLRELGFRAPQVFAADSLNGFALLEDFGDTSLAVALEQGEETGKWQSSEEIFHKVLDLVISLQKHPHILDFDLPDPKLGEWEHSVIRFMNWFWPTQTGRVATESEKASFMEVWEKMGQALPPLPVTLVHRDFYIHNLFLLEDTKAGSQIGILDFQYAVSGSPLYDVMSVIEDARFALTPDVRAALYGRYADAFPDFRAESILAHRAFYAMHRHLRNLGTYVWAALKSGTLDPLAYMPQCGVFLCEYWQNPTFALGLAPLKAWMEQNLPEFAHMLSAELKLEIDIQKLNGILKTADIII